MESRQYRDENMFRQYELEGFDGNVIDAWMQDHPQLVPGVRIRTKATGSAIWTIKRRTENLRGSASISKLRRWTAVPA